MKKLKLSNNGTLSLATNNTLEENIKLPKENTIEMKLDNKYRKVGDDHLIEYESSVFLNLLRESKKQQFNYLAEIAAQILRKQGKQAFPLPADDPSANDYNLVVIEGTSVKRIVLRTSKKGSPYDRNKREYQFGKIKDNEDMYDEIYLMTIDPDDTVRLLATDINRIRKDLHSYSRDDQGVVSDWALTTTSAIKTIDTIDLDVIAVVKFV